ncbi:hypothetical protein FRC0190_02174 [Corynebacterium rouxii]|uniref:Uncharacterized protein n=1 Tax=Corynebacterium rouxii TaxID=2719119 RepID=A0A6I8MEV2_9CORY|nr:hypothetical protein FRC0190_02174 [Corynebacterium rouxii]
MGTQPYMHSLEAFLDSTGSPTSTKRSTHHASPTMRHGFTYATSATRLHHNPLSGSATSLRHPITWLLPTKIPRTSPPTTQKHDQKISGWLVPLIHHWAHIHGYQNINWLSIDYACRPRLYIPTHPGKISLTQEPLVIRRKSFPLFIRYSCLHSHSHTLHTIKSPRCFTAVHDAPTQPTKKC